MKVMTRLETLVMNMTGCSRETANLVVNAILDEWDKAENEVPQRTESEDFEPVTRFFQPVQYRG